jgi:hypothetical protein
VEQLQTSIAAILNAGLQVAIRLRAPVFDGRSSQQHKATPDLAIESSVLSATLTFFDLRPPRLGWLAHADGSQRVDRDVCRTKTLG